MSDRDSTSEPDAAFRCESIRRRLDRVEWQQEQQELRLKEGAQAFDEVRRTIAETMASAHESHQHMQEQTQPKPVPLWKVAGFALAVTSMIGGWVWSLARYPDRNEYSKAQEIVEAEQRAVRLEVSKVKVKQINLGNDVRLIRSSVERQERTQEKLEEKLDRILDQRRVERSGGGR